MMKIAKKRSKALKDQNLRKEFNKEFQRAIKRFTMLFVKTSNMKTESTAFQNISKLRKISNIKLVC